METHLTRVKGFSLRVSESRANKPLLFTVQRYFPLTCCSNCAINHGREISNVYREEIRLEIDKQKLVPFAIIGFVAMLALLPAILHI